MTESAIDAQTVQLLQTIPKGIHFAGLLGFPISHSRSPALHNEWFQKLNLNAEYLLFPCQDALHAQQLLYSLMSNPLFLGANITIPFKQTFLSQWPISAVDSLVLKSGAANTLYRCGAKQSWHLANTDVFGIERTVTIHFPNLLNQTFDLLILGGGGAAAAVLASPLIQALRNSCQVIVRNPEQSIAKTQALSILNKDTIRTPKNWRPIPNSNLPILVINTLPLGHNNEENSIAKNTIDAIAKSGRPQCFYFDLVYSKTPAVKQAQSAGWQSCDGSTMLREQARKSFELWTGNCP